MEDTYYQNLFEHFYGWDNKKYVKVEISADQLKQAKDFVKEVIKRKSTETHYKKDGRHKETRHLTGILGEFAVTNYLQIDKPDLSIGKSRDYDNPDLMRINCNIGIKTSLFYNFPAVPLWPNRPEIICIKLTDRVISICGLASIPVILGYQSQRLIKDPKLRARNKKSGFWGFHKLRSIEEFARYKNLKKPYIK